MLSSTDVYTYGIELFKKNYISESSFKTANFK